MDKKVAKKKMEEVAKLMKKLHGLREESQKQYEESLKTMERLGDEMQATAKEIIGIFEDPLFQEFWAEVPEWMRSNWEQMKKDIENPPGIPHDPKIGVA